MVDFATIAPVIESVVSSLAGGQARWSKRPRGFSGPQKVDVTLHLAASAQGNTFDEIDYETLSEPAGTLTTTLTTKRELKVQIKVESYVDSDDAWAWTHAERIRSGFARESAQETLRRAAVALIDTEDIQNFDTKRDGRELSVAVFYATFQANSCETLTDERAGFIKTIDVTSHVSTHNDNAGVPVEVSINFSAETIPGT